MAQQAVERVGVDKHDFKRTGRMALYGGGTFASQSRAQYLSKHS